ncbi:hypothetical protein ACSBR1_006017 [Camellia fascicularis]
MALSDSKTSPNRIQYDDGLDGNDENVLQKHVNFFDRNKDGVIYPWETFQGFRAIGCGIFLSTFASFFINAGLSHKTRPGKFPSLLFPIEVKNIHKAKHGSDSGVYDTEGRYTSTGPSTEFRIVLSFIASFSFILSFFISKRFVPSKFEEIFSKHARKNANALTSDELMGMLKANRVPKDHKGWLASYTEWKILYVLCKDKNGLLQKETIRAVYDGSLFEQMAKEKASSRKQT